MQDPRVGLYLTAATRRPEADLGIPPHRKRRPPLLAHRHFSLKAVAVYAVAFAASVPAASAQQQQAASLPNGASSLQETYQDWQLACRMQDNARVCTITQDQTQKNGQRLLAVELRVGQKGGVAGTLLLPFPRLFLVATR